MPVILVVVVLNSSFDAGPDIMLVDMRREYFSRHTLDAVFHSNPVCLRRGYERAVGNQKVLLVRSKLFKAEAT